MVLTPSNFRLPKGRVKRAQTAASDILAADFQYEGKGFPPTRACGTKWRSQSRGSGMNDDIFSSTAKNAWEEPATAGTWTGYSEESRKWRQAGPVLPDRLNSVHTIAAFPTKKHIWGALNSRHRAVQQNPLRKLSRSVQEMDTPARRANAEHEIRETRRLKLGTVVRRKWNPDQLEAAILLKINERLKSNNGAVFQAFRLFNEDGGEGDASITKEEFRSVLSRLLQCTLTWEEVEELFNKYDRDGSGDIDIFEFIEGIMRPFGEAQKLAGSSWDAKDAANFSGGSFLNYKPTSSPPPKVNNLSKGINFVLEAASPPRQDPNFQPDTTNRHPHANVLRAKTAGFEHPGLSPYAVAGCISDAEREMAQARLSQMNFAGMYNSTQAFRPLRQPKNADGTTREVTLDKPWTPFRPM